MRTTAAPIIRIRNLAYGIPDLYIVIRIATAHIDKAPRIKNEISFRIEIKNILLFQELIAKHCKLNLVLMELMDEHHRMSH
jgi:hypothetical protein